jgi:hypothetical protein
MGRNMRCVRMVLACGIGWSSLCAAAAAEPVTAGANNPAYKAELYRPAANATISPKEPLPLAVGPHLFIDDYLIDKATNVGRRVNCPVRDANLPNPQITGKEDLNFQPYVTVVRDSQTGRFRVWYDARTEDRNEGRSRLATMDSDDGIHWRRPPQILDFPATIGYGASVIDRGANCLDPSSRYTLGWWKPEEKLGGLGVATSPDGLSWSLPTPRLGLIHRDIMSLFYDVPRGRYAAIVCDYRTNGPTWQGGSRVGMQSTSRDLIHWEQPWYVLTPDDRSDPPQTQFYVMGGVLIRGQLRIAMVKVLHDNLQAKGTPKGSFGVGHTQLAWSRDGETWVRDQTPFFEPDPTPGAWDHAHAWIDCQLPVGDEVYIYYAGYKNGHKVNRFEERQIGLVRMPRDRYVSRGAGANGGLLITRPVILRGGKLLVNASVRGELRVRLLDVEGEAISGFDAADCTPILGNGVTLPVEWKGSLASVKDRPVRIEFQMKDADLYGFELAE